MKIQSAAFLDQADVMLTRSYEFKSAVDYEVGPDAAVSARKTAGATTTAKRFIGHFRSLVAISNRGDVATREAH